MSLLIKILMESTSSLRFALCVAGLSIATLQPLAANESSPTIRLFVVQQPLSAVFETLGSLSNLSVQVDPGIDKSAVNTNLQGKHSQVFSQLSQQYNLYYWFDGSRYSIYLPSNLSRWSVNVDKISDDYVERTINYTAPNITSGSINFNKDLRIVNILGPRDLRDQLEKNLANFTKDNPDSISIIRFGISNR